MDVSLSTLKSLPFANVSLSSDQRMTLDHHEDSDICVVPGYDDVAKRFVKNCKVGHMNVNGSPDLNSLMHVKLWLSSLLFDVLIITETILATSLPNSQFEIQGFRLLRVDKHCFEGGVIMFIRNDFIYQRLKHVENQHGE